MSNKSLAVRLLEEKIDLNDNIVALRAFLEDKDKTREVSPRELDLMHKQLDGMKAYYAALNYRAYYHANDHNWPDEH